MATDSSGKVGGGVAEEGVRGGILSPSSPIPHKSKFVVTRLANGGQLTGSREDSPRRRSRHSKVSGGGRGAVS